MSTRRWQVWVIGALAACFLAVLLAHAYIGTFSRFMADTYCYAANVADYGFLGAQQVWYDTWTGRFAFNLGESLTGWIGPVVAPVLPALALLVWSAVLMSICVPLRLIAGRLAALALGALLSALALAITLSNLPIVQQSLYWSDGMTNYVPPLVLGGVLASLLLFAQRRAVLSRRGALGLALGAVLIAFLSGGFSEMYGALQVSALLALLAGIWAYGNPAARWRLLPLGAASLLGAALALVVVILAPGNAVRAANFPPPPHLLALIGLAAQLTGNFLHGTLANSALNLAAALVLPATLSGWLLDEAVVLRFSRAALLRVMLWTPVISLGLLLSAFAAAAYGLSGPPPARALIVPEFVLVLGVMLWSFALGGLLRQARLAQALGREALLWRAALAVALAVFGLHALQLTWQALGRQAISKAYALAWDEDDRLARAARAQGLRSVSLPALANVSGVDEAGADPSFWVNQCVSRYYGLSVVTHAAPPAPAAAKLEQATPLRASRTSARRGVMSIFGVISGASRP